MKIEGVEYRMQIASDVSRDGIGVEVYRVAETGEEFILEIFRSDSDQTYALYPGPNPIPLAVLEHVVPTARQELGPFVA